MRRDITRLLDQVHLRAHAFCCILDRTPLHPPGGSEREQVQRHM